MRGNFQVRFLGEGRRGNTFPLPDLAKPFVSETFISDVMAMLANVMPEFAAYCARA